MTISFADIAARATGTTRSASTPFYKMSVEEARGQVKVKDGNRKPAEDGSQNLTIVLGKHTLPLDVFAVGTSRVSVTADEVGAYTEALIAAVNEGSFDVQIAKAQELAEIQANKPRAARKPAVAVEATEGLDLDSLDAPEAVAEEVATEEVDLDNL